MTPSWLTDSLAGLMLVIAAYCAGRVGYARLRHRPTEHDVDVLHVFMGVAMAGMLVSKLSILSSHIWEALFVAAVVWFAARIGLALRRPGNGAGAGATADRAAIGHRLPYLLASGAMLYMFLAPVAASSGSGSGGMAGMGDAIGAASRYPTLGLGFAVFMVGFAVLMLDRTVLTTPAAISTAAPSAGSHCGLLAPRTANCCHIAMSVTMAYMLIVLL